MPILDLIGVRPVWIEDLGADAITLLDQGLVLIDDALPPERIVRVVDHVLAAALLVA